MESTIPRGLHGRNIILSSDGMHDVAERIGALLKERSNSFSVMRAGCDIFASKEVKPWLPETVRGCHVFLLHELQEPNPNDRIIQMLLTLDALSRASVTGITLVAPYLPYLRQDRKDRPRVSISARAFANWIECHSKVERLITLDMHSDQEQGFFSIPVDNLTGMVVQAEYYRQRFHNDFGAVAVVAPDVGSVVRSTRLARMLDPDLPVYLIEKRRGGPNQIEHMRYVGPPLVGIDVVLPDDMIDTGGTTLRAAAVVCEQGARSIELCATHGLFSNNAEKRFAEAGFPARVLPTISRTDEYRQQHASWLSFVSSDKLLSNAIYEASIVEGSVSKLSY